jgi:hypothetical protein
MTDKVHFYQRVRKTQRWTTMDHRTVLYAGHETKGEQRLGEITFTKYGTVFAAMTDQPGQTLYAVAFGDTLYRGESYGGSESRRGVRYRSTRFARRIHELHSSKHGSQPVMKESEAVKQNIQLRAALAHLLELVDDLVDGVLRRRFSVSVDTDVPAVRRARDLLEV